MNKFDYKHVVNLAYECGSAKYPLYKTQNSLIEQFGKSLDPPKGYDGLTIMDAYMKGYQSC